MDIQREREEFESAMFKLADGQTKNEINPVNGQYMYGVMEVMWKVWQAKAQAVPEGFVLVEKKLIKTLHEELLGYEPDSFVVNRDICELWKQVEAQEPNQTPQFNLDEFLLMEQKLKSKDSVIAADLDRFIAYAEMVLEKAKAIKEPK